MTTKEQRESAALEAAREALAERTKRLEAHGLTFDYLAKKLKRELNAKVSKAQKVKGAPHELPGGYRCITTTGIIEYVKGEEGPEREFADGESLIQWDEVDWTTRQRARQDAHKLRGDYPNEKLEHVGQGGGPIQEKIIIEFIGGEE